MQPQTQEKHLPMQASERPSSATMLMNPQVMTEVYKFAELMASGKATVPRHLQDNPADCMAVTMQAMQWGLFPYAVAQKTHLINGVLGYEAQLVSAVVNSSGVTQDRFHFEWFGPWQKVIGKFDIKQGDKGEYRIPGWKLADEEGCGVRVWSTLSGESEPRVLELLLAQARTRNSTMWADDPKQQLAYLAQKRWARLYAPDVLLGVYTPDELEQAPEREINPAPDAGQPLKTSVKNRAKKSPEADPASEPESAPQQQDDMPDFGDENDEPTISKEAQGMIDRLNDCHEMEHLENWAAYVKKMDLDKNSPDRLAMMEAYKHRKAYLEQGA